MSTEPYHGLRCPRGKTYCPPADPDYVCGVRSAAVLLTQVTHIVVENLYDSYLSKNPNIVVKPLAIAALTTALRFVQCSLQKSL